MDPLIEGYRRFRAEVWPAERARYEALAHWGQSPEAMVIACSDSRVDPQTIFCAVPGELFVVRNVAAIVPPYSPDAGHHGTSAALEFGVRVLKIPRLVVLGHGQCGGVKAMAFGPPPQAQDFLASWVEYRQPGAGRRGRQAGGAARTDRGGDGAPLPRQSPDVSLDCRGGRRRAGSRCRATGSTSTPACCERVEPDGLEPVD